ncbi:MAG: HEPN domain-containing protein [Lentisphaeria bacterium]|nr:HEPN domain-containing protein [Lentisphaeria bacterium]
MNLPPERQGERWFAQARQDLDAASVLLRAGHPNLACFHAQQAAGKAAKAFLYARGAEDVRGHSVASLLRDAASYDAAIEAWRPGGAALDKFYIATRYPNGLPDGLPVDAYTPDEATNAIARAVAILEALGTRLKP